MTNSLKIRLIDALISNLLAWKELEMVYYFREDSYNVVRCKEAVTYTRSRLANFLDETSNVHCCSDEEK